MQNTAIQTKSMVIEEGAGIAPSFDSNDVFRLTASLFADEMARRTKRAPAAHDQLSWTRETLIDEDGLGFDSLARLDAAIRINRFFHLHEVGFEDYLLLEKTLGGWCAIIERSLVIRHERVTFQTSGSTGKPKEVEHVLADLHAEIGLQADLFANRRRIVALVPPHHIFGLLTTVLLPKALNLPIVDARAWGPGAWNRDLAPGDLVVATPFLWGVLERGLRTLPNDVMGVTSTAPMSGALATALIERGLSDLIELYGSSETAGVGHRSVREQAFTLFRHLSFDGTSVLRDGVPLPLQDHLDWHSSDSFTPAGRKDRAFQVGGVNVHPDHVEDVLRRSPLVADCAVRLSNDGQDDGRGRLRAFIVLSEQDSDKDSARDGLDAHCRAHLQAVERPCEFSIGAVLPRDSHGKLRDW
ncbi:MAG: 4-coumarate--CoA ligase [Pseudomonadota bacterium]